MDLESETSARLARLEHACGTLLAENERLRLRNRWVMRVAGVAGLALAVGLGLGAARQDDPKVIEAEGFVLKDRDGKVLARLGPYVNAEGTTTRATNLTFYGDAGNIRAVFGVGSTLNPFLNMMDSKGEDTLSLAIGARDNPSVSVTSPSGNASVSLSAGEGASGLVLRSAAEGLPLHRGALLVTPDGQGFLHFFRPESDGEGGRLERLRVGLRADGTSELVLRGEAPDSGVRAVARPDGQAGVRPKAE
jgi:hypothetical protein